MQSVEDAFVLCAGDEYAAKLAASREYTSLARTWLHAAHALEELVLTRERFVLLIIAQAWRRRGAASG